MSVEKAKEFLMALNEKEADEALNEKAAAAKTEAEKIALAAALAHETGYDVTEADIREALTALKQDSEEAVPLNDEDVGNVAGGSGQDKGPVFGMICSACGERVHAAPTGREKSGWFFTKKEYLCPVCNARFWRS